MMMFTVRTSRIEPQPERTRGLDPLARMVAALLAQLKLEAQRELVHRQTSSVEVKTSGHQCRTGCYYSVDILDSCLITTHLIMAQSTAHLYYINYNR